MRKFCVVFVLPLLCSYLAFANPRATKSQDRDNEENERIASLVITEVIGKAQLEEGQRFFQPESVVRFGDKNLSLRGAIEEAQFWRRLFPDFEIKVVNVESRGNRVTVHWKASGTNTGTGGGIPVPTGIHIRTHGSSEFVFANGKIVDSSLHWNETEVLRQLLGLDRDDKDDKDDKHDKDHK
jgi:predicted ester cyclase